MLANDGSVIAVFGRTRRLRRRRFSRSPLGARIARLRHRKALHVARIVRLPAKSQEGNMDAHGNAVGASFSGPCEALARLFVARAARVCRLSSAPKPLLACDDLRGASSPALIRRPLCQSKIDTGSCSPSIESSSPGRALRKFPSRPKDGAFRSVGRISLGGLTRPLPILA